MRSPLKLGASSTAAWYRQLTQIPAVTRTRSWRRTRSIRPRERVDRVDEAALRAGDLLVPAHQRRGHRAGRDHERLGLEAADQERRMKATTIASTVSRC